VSLRIGLTGGIGSGKSSVAATLRELQIPVIDADEQSRRLTAAGGVAIPAVRDAFGDRFIDNTGAMDRTAMRELVFRDPTAKRRLEALLHPLIGAALAREAQAAAERGAKAVVFDIPLLVESGHWRTRLDRVWVVDCSTETQVERVIRRSEAAGQPMVRSAVQAIIAQQAAREQRLAAADAVIFNEGIDLAALRDLARKLALSLPTVEQSAAPRD
jgi:dephospho-CoA kinase